MCVKNRKKIITSRLLELKGEKVSVTDFAKECGIKQPVMDRYLRRGYEPKIQQLIQICERKNCTLNWIVGLSNDRYSHDDTSEFEWRDRATKAEAELRKYKAAFAKITKSLKSTVEVIEELQETAK